MRYGLFLVMAASGILISSDVHAAGGSDYEVTYYKERELKTQVGTFYKPCGTGAAKLTGRRSPYFTKSQSTCPGGGHSSSSTISCHFTEAGCTDSLARMVPKKTHKTAKKEAAGKS